MNILKRPHGQEESPHSQQPQELESEGLQTMNLKGYTQSPDLNATELVELNVDGRDSNDIRPEPKFCKLESTDNCLCDCKKCRAVLAATEGMIGVPGVNEEVVDTAIITNTNEAEYHQLPEEEENENDGIVTGVTVHVLILFLHMINHMTRTGQLKFPLDYKTSWGQARNISKLRSMKTEDFVDFCVRPLSKGIVLISLFLVAKTS